MSEIQILVMSVLQYIFFHLDDSLKQIAFSIYLTSCILLALDEEILLSSLVSSVVMFM